MMSTELGELSERVNSLLNLQYDYRYDDPSDPNRFSFARSFNYARKGIR